MRKLTQDQRRCRSGLAQWWEGELIAEPASLLEIGRRWAKMARRQPEVTRQDAPGLTAMEGFDSG
jgi:hypothetical protein